MINDSTPHSTRRGFLKTSAVLGGALIAPAILPGTKGTHYFLRTTTLGSVQQGASILYRGQEIGKVVATKLVALNSFQLQIFVNDPYDQFVRQGSEFWSGSPFALRNCSMSLYAVESP